MHSTVSSGVTIPRRMSSSVSLLDAAVPHSAADVSMSRRLAEVLRAAGIDKQTGSALLNTDRPGVMSGASAVLERRLRIQALLEINANVRQVLTGPQADRWLVEVNRGPLLGGASPVSFLLAAGTSGFTALRNLTRRWAAGL